LLIAQLLRRLPDSAGKIVGITSIDLFSPVLTFVFGQSQLDGPGAIVSTHRLRNEYYGLPCDEELMFQRTLKEVLHELGHAFGLIHCADFRCVMSASSHVGEVDLKRAWYCPQCQTVLTVGHWQ
jgi:archaemetzincin